MDRSSRLDRNAPTPLWAQIRDDLRARIDAGEFPNGRLPSELDLVDEYEAGRITVRHAVTDLVNAGVLVRVQGRGTFVVS